MKILLFADRVASAAVRDVFQNRGHQVDVCADEAQAWEAYQEGGHALVLLGPSARPHEALALCRRIRALPRGRRSLVLAGTASVPGGGLEAFWEAGADDFFVFSTDRQQLDTRAAVLERQASALVKRFDAEESLRNRIELEELIATLSTAFINIDPDEVDRGIQRALKAIGEYALADRSYVFQLAPDGNQGSNTHEWCAPGVQPEIHNLQGLSADAFPWFVEQLRRLQVVHIPRRDQLPPEARAERDMMEAQGVQATVIVPLALGRSLKGFLGFDLVREERRWTEHDIRLLKTVGDIIVNALERKRTEEALLQSEERFRRLVENAADAFFVCDLEGRIVDVNQRACESLGYTRGELLKRRLDEIEEEPALKDTLLGWKDALRSAPLTVETVQRRKDGSQFPAEARVGFFEEGDRPLVLLLVRDASERKKAEEALLASEERFRQVTEGIREVFWLTNTEKVEMIYISPGYEEIWGRTRESLYREPRSWLDAIVPEDRTRVFEAAMSKQANGLYDEEYRITRPDGTIRWIRDRAFPIRNQAGKVYRVAGIAEDITERKRMEREVVEISGREQRRIGQDLHDGLGQSLTGVAFLSKAIQERLAEKGAPEAADMEKVVRLVNDAIAHTQGLGRGLYPVELETNGLVAALRELAGQTEAVFKVPCSVEAGGEALGTLGQDAQIHLYRIAQEALTNAVKHGKAKRIAIRLSSEGGKTTLAVTDDGVGVPEPPREDGMGLRIMNYRARVIGASLALRRPAQGGTIVACTLAHRA